MIRSKKLITCILITANCTLHTLYREVASMIHSVDSGRHSSKPQIWESLESMGVISRVRWFVYHEKVSRHLSRKSSSGKVGFERYEELQPRISQTFRVRYSSSMLERSKRDFSESLSILRLSSSKILRFQPANLLYTS